MFLTVLCVLCLATSYVYGLKFNDHEIAQARGNSSTQKLWIVETSGSHPHRIDSKFAIKHSTHGHAEYLPKYKYNKQKLGNTPWLVKTILPCDHVPNAVKVTHNKWLVNNASFLEDIANVDCVLYIQPYKTVKAVPHVKRRQLKPEGFIAVNVKPPQPMYSFSDNPITVFIADTSLDYSLCSLHDNLIEPTKTLWTSSSIPDTNHKHIRAILNQFNTGFKVNDASHGTSVTTVVLDDQGDCQSSATTRVLFLTMLPTHSTNEHDELIVPYDLNLVLNKMSSLGASVSVFAWSGGDSIYEYIAEDIDLHNFNNPTSFIVGATPNDGDEAGTPCVSKTILCLGTSAKSVPDLRTIPQIVVKDFGIIAGYAFDSFVSNHLDTHYFAGNSALTAYYAKLGVAIQRNYLKTHGYLPWSSTVRSLLMLNDTSAPVVNNSQPMTIHGIVTKQAINFVLTWIDAPAMAGSSKPLVYDLDALVTINGKQIALETDDYNPHQIVSIPNVKENDTIAIYVISVADVKWSIAYTGFDITWSDQCLDPLPCDNEGIEYKSCLPAATCKPKTAPCVNGEARFCTGGVVHCLNGIYPDCSKPIIHIQSTQSSALSSGLNFIFVIYVVLINIIHNT